MSIPLTTLLRIGLLPAATAVYLALPGAFPPNAKLGPAADGRFIDIERVVQHEQVSLRAEITNDT